MARKNHLAPLEDGRVAFRSGDLRDQPDRLQPVEPGAGASA